MTWSPPSRPTPGRSARPAFEEVIRANDRNPRAGSFRFDSPAVVEIVARARSERQSAASASGFLKTVSIPELRKAVLDGRGTWVWFGPDCTGGTPEPVRYDPQTRHWRFGGLGS